MKPKGSNFPFLQIPLCILKGYIGMTLAQRKYDLFIYVLLLPSLNKQANKDIILVFPTFAP